MNKDNKYYFSLLFIGIAIRLAAYFYNRALWFDEALLANNIITLSFTDLAGVLPNNQAAPIGFLFLQKLLISFLGSSEYILRLAPLLTAILSIILFYRLSQKVVSSKFALVALAFFVFSQPHMYYSTEVKQYVFDVLTTILVLLSTVKLTENFSRNRIAQHTFLGVVLVWFSQPVIFVLGASFATLSFRFYRRGEMDNWKKLFPVVLLWGISFSLYFFCFLAPSIANSNLQDYHTAYFMPLNIGVKETWQWYANAWFSLFRNPVGVLFKYLAGSITMIGIICTFKKKTDWLFLFLVPVFLAFVASALHKYSTIPRLMLFALPALLLTMVISLEWLYNYLKSKHKWGHYLGGLIIVSILLQPILDTIHEIARPEKVEEIKPILNYIATHKKVEDILYLYPYASPQFDYYKKKYGLTQMNIVEGQSPFEDWQTDIANLVQEKKRVWLLFSHYRKIPQGDDPSLYAQQFDQYGKQIAKIKRKGSVCYLYEFKSLKQKNEK